MLEGLGGAHASNLPFEGAAVYFDGRVKTYADENGYFELYVPRLNAVITIKTPFGAQREIAIINGHTDYNLKKVPLLGYDLNNDSFVNIRDFAIFQTYCKTQSTDINGKSLDYNKDGVISKSDWQFATKFYSQHFSVSDLYN